ncbi:MAG: ATP-binding protein [Candidatus Cryptobacteroides sp.]
MEKLILQKVVDKNKAQIVVVYGRRRVGKTYLINEFFGNKFSFKHTALSPFDTKSPKGLLQKQLNEFYYSLRTYGLQGGTPSPGSWSEALHLLQELLDSKADGTNQVIFIDELPWMDTPRSGFVQAFEHFCNDWCSARKHVKLIVCGSATSWIFDEMLDNKGGLYDRVTSSIYVKPFTLSECEELLKEEGFHLDRYDIIQAYMAFGGIPYYLTQFREDLSVVQNIDALLFNKDSLLYDEFDRLFSSQFANPETLKSIIQAIGRKRCGLTRDEIIGELKISAGGTFSKALQALEKSKLVASYRPFGEKVLKYRLSDQFCSFYLHYVKKNKDNKNFWQTHYNSPAMYSWLGLAFEEIVFGHIEQVKHALGISGVQTTESAWNIDASESREGMQIDLVIDRADRIVNVCEIKFCNDEYSVSSEYSRKLMSRVERTSEFFNNRRSIANVLITTYGLKRNEYSSRFQKVVTMDDLFRF